MKFLITGAAGFIGYHTCQKLLNQGHEILGYDNINDYYDTRFKFERLDILRSFSGFRLVENDLEDFEALEKCWQAFQPEYIIHLAAQAGVRHSLSHPMVYVSSNMVGFQNVLELVRLTTPKNFIYASSSSVYGGLTEHPFRETQDVSSPISLYAVSKRENELAAKCYSHLFQLPSTGLRFFTAYGPNSRPDMAMFKFANLMSAGKPITVYNHGKMVRDFTFVEDIVDGILAATAKPEQGQIYNLGRGKPVLLSEMISLLEESLGIEALKEYLPIQPGDVNKTIADISKARKNLGFDPKIDLEEGVKRFSDWYLNVFMNQKAS